MNPKILLVIAVCLLTNTVFAQSVSIQNDFYYLNANHQPTCFVIKNISNNSLWLDRYFGKNHPPVSAGWSSEIDGKKWSALVVQHGSFVLSCSHLDNNKIEALDCKHFIKIHPMKFKDFNHEKFTGWLSENQNFFALFHEILQRKIWLRHCYKLLPSIF